MTMTTIYNYINSSFCLILKQFWRIIVFYSQPSQPLEIKFDLEAMKHPLVSFLPFWELPYRIFLTEKKATLIKISETPFPILTLMSSKKTPTETEPVLTLILETDLSSEPWDPLKILPMRWQSLQPLMPNKWKQLLKGYKRERALKNSSNNLSKKHEQSDFKVMDIVKNGKLKLSEEVCMSTKISPKFILLWRKNKKFSKIWRYAAKKKLILVRKWQSLNTNRPLISNSKHYY